MRILITCLLLICAQLFNAQTDRMDAFQSLMDKTWVAEGKWANGTDFKQSVTFNYNLDSNIVVANSKGFINKAQTKFGNRNHGIRKFNDLTRKLEFWEFDVFGGLTKGEMLVEGQDLYYLYLYGGKVMTDMWKKEDDSTYQFKVGVYSDGLWKEVYLDTKFHAQARPNNIPDLKKLLPGTWSSKAWDGSLMEKWTIGHDGHLHQQGKYIENGKVTYEANTKMEIVGEDIILFTVIKGSNPKIFKATSWSPNHITFENSEYDNPSVVTYEFLPGGFSRTISGLEDKKPTTYTFEFQMIQ